MAVRMRQISLALMALLIVIAIGGGLYILNLTMSDNLNYYKGSLEEAIVARSATVRDFPQFSVLEKFNAGTEAVKFTYSARDGTAPEQFTMRYDSSESPDHLLQKHKAYCRQQGFAEVAKDKYLLRSELACDAPDYRIEIDFELPAYNATMVTVTFLEQ